MLLEKKVQGSRPAKTNTAYGMPSEGILANRPKMIVKTDHRENGLKHGPGHAEDGLLVADLDVPQHEEVQQLPRFPKLGPVDGDPACSRPYDEDPGMDISFAG